MEATRPSLDMCNLIASWLTQTADFYFKSKCLLIKMSLQTGTLAWIQHAHMPKHTHGPETFAPSQEQSSWRKSSGTHFVCVLGLWFQFPRFICSFCIKTEVTVTSLLLLIKIIVVFRPICKTPLSRRHITGLFPCQGESEGVTRVRRLDEAERTQILAGQVS